MLWGMGNYKIVYFRNVIENQLLNNAEIRELKLAIREDLRFEKISEKDL